MSTVNNGDSVKVHYEGRFEDGEIFDKSEGRGALEFEAGSDQLIPGFSNGVVGMAVGDKKTLTLPPAEAYGDRDPARVQEVELGVLPEGVKVGDHLQGQSGEHVVQLLVTALGESAATLDGNHPLAGKTLIFDIEVVGIEPAGD